MKIRRPRLIRVVAVVGAWVVRLLMATVSYRVRVRGLAVHPDDPNLPGRFIYAFWHETMLFMAGRRARGKFCVLVSQSADGELIAQVAQRLGHQVARGSSTRGGAHGLWELIGKSRSCHLAVTPDGPRGPRRQVKSGVIYLASRTGLPIVAAGIAFVRCWRARSWDRFAVPWPFTEGVGVAGRPLYVPPNLDRPEIERYRQELEARLLEATARAEEWAARQRGEKIEHPQANRQVA
jgi:hypothetical protein